MQVLSECTYTFSKDGKPIAHAKPGETVKFVTRDCNDGQIQREDQYADHINWEQCNPATGPLFIDGAEPGDVLAVDILNIDVDDHGVVCTIPELGPLWPSCELRTHLIDIRDGYAIYKDVKWPIDPMIGVIGTAPDGDNVSSGFVFNGGGNMDSQIITKGHTLWLPVRVPGALLAMGDIHATMADGEVIGNGIEIAGEITVRVRLVKNFELNWPVTETRDAWFVNTCGATCDEAIERGYKEMQRLISQAYGWDMTDTAMYMSIQSFLCSNQACLTPDEGGDTFRTGTPKVASKPRLIG